MFKNTLIIGCGLIGSSLLRCVIKKNLSKNIFVFEKSKKNFKVIKKISPKVKFIKKIDKQIFRIDFIILATPMSQYQKIFDKIKKFLSKKAIITDVASTKENIEKLIKKNSNLEKSFISGHPIAGSEVSGPKFGNEKLFKNKWCIIIKNKNKKNQSKVMEFWRKVGSKIVIMNAKEHDNIFSITSHLPHLVAYNLIKTAVDFQKKNRKPIIKYSAGGLRDFSRTAASNEIMWRDIFFSNKKNIIKSIEIFIKNLNNFKKIIKNRRNKNLIKILKDSKKVRKQIINLKQDISKPNFGRDQF